MTTNHGGNFYNKYESGNPIVQWIMSGFLSSFDQLVERVQPDSIHEVGCGEGYLSQRLSRSGYAVRGTDVSSEAIDQAQSLNDESSVSFEEKSIHSLTVSEDGAELIVCCEVLEHLERPDEAMDILCQLADPYLLLSVPREPLWRVLNLARFRYISELGNTPGHIQHWSRKGFIQFVGSYCEIVERRSPLPWTMLLARTDR